MTQTHHRLRTDLPPFPWHRECPYHPPAHYAMLRETEPVARVELATGTSAWLVTRYDLVRQVLNDPRLSSDRADPNFPYFIPVPPQFRTNASFLGMDPPEHTRHRRRVAGAFTTKRVKTMRPHIQQVVDDCLTRMLETGPPADLVQALSLPVPTAVICELLGVPQSDLPFFHERTRMMMGGASSAEERRTGLIELEGFLHDLVVAKERDPGSDLLSELVAEYRAEEAYDREELVSLARLLLVAGHETSANMISLGTMTLLEHPDQLALLRQDPGLAASAAEELLRYLTVADLATSRVATEDIELDGVVIRAGEGIIAVGAAANRDPAAFPDPDTLDIRRTAQHHVTFGFGRHFCVGADLSRLELEVVFGTLFGRIPSLRMAEPIDALSYKDGAIMYGVYEMPVTW
ncbi:cytochrome P450 [Prauserella shujinwangii]|uniref:Cytochrome P450 n=1 Tax=Prauserella shujinwangii TaxID=1453103 RepID=A0A2T0M3Y7_9PSEU|nr:cytochrome P450 [Prauserella shujinwangii]PRX51440.1 cytochrome P450 [Prauserella shujinwangii]